MLIMDENEVISRDLFSVDQLEDSLLQLYRSEHHKRRADVNIAKFATDVKERIDQEGEAWWLENLFLSQSLTESWTLSLCVCVFVHTCMSLLFADEYPSQMFCAILLSAARDDGIYEEEEDKDKHVSFVWLSSTYLIYQSLFMA